MGQKIRRIQKARSASAARTTGGAGPSWGPPDTQAGVGPTPQWENRMLKKARNKAAEIVLSSADLYRDMALSALRLVGRKV